MVVGREVYPSLVRQYSRARVSVPQGAIKVRRDPLPLALRAQGRIKIHEIVRTRPPVVVIGARKVLESHAAQKTVQVEAGVVPVGDGLVRCSGRVEVLEVFHKCDELLERVGDGVVADVDDIVAFVVIGACGAPVDEVCLYVAPGCVHLCCKQGGIKRKDGRNEDVGSNVSTRERCE